MGGFDFFLLRSAFITPHPQDPLQRQHCKSEQLQYLGRKFLMKLEVSTDAEDSDPDPSSGEGPTGRGHTPSSSDEAANDPRQLWSSCMREMMSNDGDFPPRGHPITRW